MMLLPIAHVMPGLDPRLSGLAETVVNWAPPQLQLIPVPGLVPGTHAFSTEFAAAKTWMAGTSPATGRFWVGIRRKIPHELASPAKPDGRGLDPAIWENNGVAARNKSRHGDEVGAAAK